MEEKVQATGIIDSVEALEARMAEMRKAQTIFATYSQEQVDKIFKAAATAADKARIPLAINSNLQDPYLLKDPQRHHHFPASACKEQHDRRSKDRS